MCFYFKPEKSVVFNATKMPIADFHHYWSLRSELVKCLWQILFGNCWEAALASGSASKMGRMKMHISRQVVKVKWETEREERREDGFYLQLSQERRILSTIPPFLSLPSSLPSSHPCPNRQHPHPHSHRHHYSHCCYLPCHHHRHLHHRCRHRNRHDHLTIADTITFPTGPRFHGL